MWLKDLNQYNPITIQCHDNPDADAIASGYALYSYFKDLGKEVALIYSGKFEIQKSNLKLMIEELNIPISFVRESDEPIKGLLITVDCQYGEGNVYKFTAEEIAVIDHHQMEIQDMQLCEINSSLGSCSTLVWKLLTDEGYPINEKNDIGTALYYGLYTDTNQFSEIYNPIDMDMRESVTFNKSDITRFRNANISLKELETAGIALIRNIYNEEYRYAIIKAETCDPNILGIISDFLLQVDAVDSCVVYNEIADGYKISVRSCTKEVKANELAEYLCERVGSGGGHVEKAGGFISHKLYSRYYPGMHTEAYFSTRLISYFANTDIIYSSSITIDTSNMKQYVKKKIPLGFVKASDVFPIGTPITVRTLEGDVDLVVSDELIIMIGIKGDIYPSTREKFSRSYEIVEGKFQLNNSFVKEVYIPKIKDRLSGHSRQITEFADICISTGETRIYSKKISNITKVFTSWDEETYMLGKPGDYLAIRNDDIHDIYVVEKEIFHLIYDEYLN